MENNNKDPQDNYILCVYCSNIWRQMENSNKDLKDNYIFGADFGTDNFYIVSLPENYLSGVFPWPHLDFCDKCNHGLYSF